MSTINLQVPIILVSSTDESIIATDAASKSVFTLYLMKYINTWEEAGAADPLTQHTTGTAIINIENLTQPTWVNITFPSTLFYSEEDRVAFNGVDIYFDLMDDELNRRSYVWGRTPPMNRYCMQGTEVELIAAGYTINSGPHASWELCRGNCS